MIRRGLVLALLFVSGPAFALPIPLCGPGTASDVGASDPVDCCSISDTGLVCPANATGGQCIVLREGADDGTDAFVLCTPPTGISALVTCTLDGAGQIPDSCVGDGTDATGSGVDLEIDGASVGASIDFDDGGDLDFTNDGDGTASVVVKPDAVLLSTDTTGNYAAGDAEAGAALTGDSATGFFSSGTLETARGGSAIRSGSLSAMGVTACGDPTVYLGFDTAHCSATEATSDTTLSLTASITVVRLACYQPLDTSCSWRVTLRKNETSPGAPDLQCAGTTSTACVDTGSTSFDDGDEIAILIEDTGTNCTNNIPYLCSLYYTF